MLLKLEKNIENEMKYFLDSCMVDEMSKNILRKVWENIFQVNEKQSGIFFEKTRNGNRKCLFCESERSYNNPGEHLTACSSEIKESIMTMTNSILERKNLICEMYSGKYEFSDETKNDIYLAANCQCCICGKSLVIVLNDKIEKLGNIAHIYGATAFGPRSISVKNLTMDEEKIKEILTHFSNGLLLCSNCHLTIDTFPSTFTVEYLNTIRKEHYLKNLRNTCMPEILRNVLVAQVMNEEKEKELNRLENEEKEKEQDKEGIRLENDDTKV